MSLRAVLILMFAVSAVALGLLFVVIDAAYPDCGTRPDWFVALFWVSASISLAGAFGTALSAGVYVGWSLLRSAILAACCTVVWGGLTFVVLIQVVVSGTCID